MEASTIVSRSAFARAEQLRHAPLLTKRDVAAHYRFSVRWVEMQLAKGMPSRLVGGRRRFDLGDVDAWLHSTYGGP
jgi:hypothetical protein